MFIVFSKMAMHFCALFSEKSFSKNNFIPSTLWIPGGGVALATKSSVSIINIF
jgi:hypothetical protein